MAREWDRIAGAVARKTGKRFGLVTRMTLDADLVPDREAGASPVPAPLSELNPRDEFKRFVSGARQRTEFRLQFRFDPTDRGSVLLEEVDVLASDVPGAIREAAYAAWPPGAIGFRLVDREGRVLIGRQKPDRRWW